ncbi:TRAP transporter substrate-binding protein DctP [Alkalihalobacterium elongatum]|uniref:TRAP transporter substrate-binding protein DctP n=1 Tax=Alkalihalobacterium elongatum TaxID=2675466 RepID=UPI001C1F6008|nr:TRAP transporter substrate-binding protein DctP [Alkalihalobacterium elongatum]
MKRKSFFTSIIILVFVALLTGCLNKEQPPSSSSPEGNSESSNQTFNWRMSSTYVQGSIQFERDVRFVELVNSLSNGRLNISLHQVGELADGASLLDTVSNGTIEMGGDWPGSWRGRNTAFNLLGTTPVGFTAWDYLMWIYAADGHSIYNEIYGAENLVYFPYNAPGTESGIRSNKPINSVEDLQGMNIRFVGTIQEKILQEFGGNPANVAPNELYEALQRGVLDAIEFSSPAGDKAMNFDEVTSYVAVPSWHQTASVTGVMINQDAWETLPEDIKLIIEVAAKTTMLETTTNEMFKDALVTNEMLEQGDITVTEYPNEDLEKIHELAKKFAEELADENPDFAKVLNSQKKYMEDYSTYREMQGEWGFGTNSGIFSDIN